MDMTEFLTDPAEANEAFHGILYGESGCGKTSTLDDDNYKVLVVDMEGGTSVLQGAKNVKRLDVPQIAKKTKKHPFEVMMEIGEDIEAGKFMSFDLIGMDSGTAFEEIVKDYIAIKYAPNRRREIQDKFGAQADWGDLRDLQTRFVRWFHTFTKRGDKSQHILWMFHVAKETDPDNPSRLIRTKIALQGSTTPDIIMSIVDGYFYMYNKDIIKDKAFAGVERGILTRGAQYAAKARVSKRRKPLPDKIINPAWSEIFHTLGYDRK